MAKSRAFALPKGFSRLLLVEGNMDKEFFVRLGIELYPDLNKPAYHIIECGGKDAFEDMLRLIQLDDLFPLVTHIGIIRDADFNEGVFDSILNALQSTNTAYPDRPQYGIPKQPEQFTDSTPSVGVFIMPDAENDGMLETLIIRALENDPIMDCVDDYIDCLRDKNIIPKTEALPKATMRVYGAAVEARMHTYIQGKNMDESALTSDRNKSYLSDIYKMQWWTWDKPVFERIKAFVMQLANHDDTQTKDDE